jgi:hypothetical protein
MNLCVIVTEKSFTQRHEEGQRKKIYKGNRSLCVELLVLLVIRA